MHLFAACFKGINDMASNRLKSRNVHSEIVFSFAPNNNVSILDFRILLQSLIPIRSPNLSAGSAFQIALSMF